MASPHTKRVPFSSLAFNEKAQRYYIPKGQGRRGTGFLKPEAVREIIDEDIVAAGQRMKDHSAKLKPIAEQFRAGQITQTEYLDSVQRWRDDMAMEIKALHLGNVAVGKGGFHQMDQRDFGRAGALIREQYKYLNEFVVQVGSDPDIVLGGAKGRMGFEDRVGMYAEAGRGTYEATRRQAHKDAGFLYESNVLEDGAHHCKGKDGCPAQTELGRVEIGTLRPIGKRPCGPNCKCEIRYRY